MSDMCAAIRPLLTVTMLGALAAACGLFAPANTSQCTESRDCPASHVCAQGLCKPESNLVDGGAGDTAVSDAIVLDRPRLDAVTDRTGVVDGSTPDAAAYDLVSDRMYSDGVVAVDVAAADATPFDTSPPDSAQPDTADAASFDAYDPCGNGTIDGDEVCDGQDGCQPGGCEPLPGLQCSDAGAGTILCYPYFTTGFPSHGIANHAQPAQLPTVHFSCVASTISTDIVGETANLCGTQVPAVVLPQSGGPDLLVLYMRQLYLPGNVRFGGTRIPVFVVYGDADVSGTIDVGANGTAPGPGSDIGLCGVSNGGTGGESQDCGGGGGGGGNFTWGGLGGSIGTIGGTAGSALAPPEGSLLGGCSGGVGNRDNQLEVYYAPGGAGGGAIQISAAWRLVVSGTIYADGAGGAGGRSSNKGGGGGGGSGGAIYLEARSIDISFATLPLTGGGGGGGASTAAAGTGGSAGRVGGTGGDGVSRGGNGSTNDLATGGTGTDGSQGSDYGGGGGGGGYGRLLVTTLPLQ